MTAGYRGAYGIWVGGAAAVPPPGGFRSLYAFWTGGASAGTIVPPPVVFSGSGAHWRAEIPTHLQHLKEDELILLVISSAIPRLLN